MVLTGSAVPPIFNVVPVVLGVPKLISPNIVRAALLPGSRQQCLGAVVSAGEKLIVNAGDDAAVPVDAVVRTTTPSELLPPAFTETLAPFAAVPAPAPRVTVGRFPIVMSCAVESDDGVVSAKLSGNLAALIVPDVMADASIEEDGKPYTATWACTHAKPSESRITEKVFSMG